MADIRDTGGDEKQVFFLEWPYSYRDMSGNILSEIPTHIHTFIQTNIPIYLYDINIEVFVC